MSEIQVYGCSDDLIEIQGDLREEFGRYAIGKWSFLAFDDGTVLRVGYAVDDTGNWRVERIRQGRAEFTRITAELRQVDDESEYSDIGALVGDFNPKRVRFYTDRAPAMAYAKRAAEKGTPDAV